MRLAARAREQRMREAAEELQRKLLGLRKTVAMIETNQQPADGAAADSPPASDAAGATPAPAQAAPLAPSETAPRPPAHPPPRPKPPVKFVRRNLNKFSREAFMADFEAMQERERSDS